MKLKRVSIIDQGAFGVLIDSHGIPFAVTLERTYKLPDGTQSIKIIPGVYLCTHTMYYKGAYATFEINVEGHERILFHKGNVETDSEGCVLIGEQFEVLNNVPAILQSGKGFAEFMAKVGDMEEFYLTIE